MKVEKLIKNLDKNLKECADKSIQLFDQLEEKRGLLDRYRLEHFVFHRLEWDSAQAQLHYDDELNVLNKIKFEADEYINYSMEIEEKLKWLNGVLKENDQIR